MKVLFSTKYLALQLEKALEDRDFNWIEFTDNEFIFKRTEKNDLVLKLEHAKDSYSDIDCLKIDRVQWFKLMDFLKQLPEQPIVLEIIDYGNDDILIRLSQFVMEF